MYSVNGREPIRFERPPAEPSGAEASTSARLAQTQRDLAASQADLTRALQDRAEAIEERDWAREVVGMLRKNEEIRAQVIRERNAERLQLRDEIARLLAQFPACERCTQHIHAGEPVETTPGSPHLLLHITCPTPPSQGEP